MCQAKVQYTSHLHDEGDVCRYCPAPSLGNSRSCRGGGGLSVNMSVTSKRKYLTITTVSHGQEHKRKQAASCKALLVKCGFRLYGIYGFYSRGCAAVCLRRQGDRVWSAYTNLFLNPKRSLERFGSLWKASCFSRYPFLYATGHFDLRVCLIQTLWLLSGFWRHLVYAFSLDIARYAFGKVRINLLAINTEISTKSNDRFRLKESISMTIVN